MIHGHSDKALIRGDSGVNSTINILCWRPFGVTSKKSSFRLRSSPKESETRRAMSIEALAMAGADYIKCGIDLQELEREDMEKTPQYLLAEQSPRNKSEENERDKMPLEKWQVMEEEMEAWAKAVATFNVFLLQISGLERTTNLHPQGNVTNPHDVSKLAMKIVKELREGGSTCTRRRGF